MHLDIITPEQTLFSGEVKSVQLPGSAGSFEVLDNHAPLISTLDPGKIRVRTNDGQEEYFEVESGFVEVLNNKATVLIEGATSLE